MKKLFFLSVIMIALNSCTETFQENKFQIVDIIPSYNDSTKREFSISFKVNYYSDSTEKEGMVYKQKGLSGSADSIIYFGTKKKQFDNNCLIQFDSFVNIYNNQQFKGEISRFPVVIRNLKPNCKFDSIFLVMYNKKNGIIDTIASAIRDNPYQL